MNTKTRAILVLFILIFLISIIAHRINVTHSSQETNTNSVDTKTELPNIYKNQPWELNTFVDEFGDNTNKKYISTHTEGIFSNSATSGSILYVEVFFTKTSTGIFLHEYNQTSPPIKLIGSGRIKLKNSNNEILIIPLTREWNTSGGLKIYDSDEGYSGYSTMLRKFIQKSVGEIKVVIIDKYSSSYKFSIDVTGFMNAYLLL